MTLLEAHTLDSRAQEQAQQWFALTQSGEMSLADQTSFDQWYANTVHANYYDQITDFWNSTEFTIAAKRIDEQQSNVTNGHKKQSKHFFNLRMWSIAASFLFIFAINFNTLSLQLKSDYLTSTGEQQLVHLDDGSKLTLNTASAVKVEVNNQHRKITLLAGEIYLDVSKDSGARPFHVYADDVLVEVLGTRFSVKQTDDNVIVSGHSGHIAVSNTNHKPQVITAGERIQINTDEVINDYLDPNQAFAWLNNRLVFKNKPLKDVIAELNRYHDGTFLIINDVAAETRITGSYSLTDPIKTAHAISQVVKLQSTDITPWVTLIH